MVEQKPIYILTGVAGSVAQGLATAASDKDLHGVYSYPTPAYWGLGEPPSSLVNTDPDESYHELKKFLTLALRCNPTTLELLWLDSYEQVESDWGERLVGIRGAFVSAPGVKNAYLGFARSQLQKTEGTSGEREMLARKNLKHAVRLIEQGMRLYTTGTMQVVVEDRNIYDDILYNWSIDQSDTYARQRYAAFATAEPDARLKAATDFEAANNYLREYRAAHVEV